MRRTYALTFKILVQARDINLYKTIFKNNFLQSVRAIYIIYLRWTHKKLITKTTVPRVPYSILPLYYIRRYISIILCIHYTVRNHITSSIYIPFENSLQRPFRWYQPGAHFLYIFTFHFTFKWLEERQSLNFVIGAQY